MKTPYRILSLDGGGSWSIIQIKALKKLFGDITGHEILKHFDLVAANSGGSIVAAGLAENYRPSQLEAFFNDPKTLHSIYSKLSFWEIPFINRFTKVGGIGPRYSSRRKYEAFQRLMPKISNMPLHKVPEFIGSDDSPHFLIVAFDYNRSRAKFFRSDTTSQSRTALLTHKLYGKPEVPESKITFTQAIHTSTNAPLNYFDQPALLNYEKEVEEPKRYWDGAIGGYNNPVLSAIVEAISNGIKMDELQVLSIGTGYIFRPFEGSFPATNDFLLERYKNANFLNDVFKLTTSILGDPPDAATYVSYTMLYPDLPMRVPDFIRLNPLVQPQLKFIKDQEMWAIPDGFTTKQFERLLHLDFDATSDEDIALLEQLTDLWLSDLMPNQPIRNNRYLQCLLGHQWFSQAWSDLMSWKSLA